MSKLEDYCSNSIWKFTELSLITKKKQKTNIKKQYNLVMLFSLSTYCGVNPGTMSSVWYMNQFVRVYKVELLNNFFEA